MPDPTIGKVQKLTQRAEGVTLQLLLLKRNGKLSEMKLVHSHLLTGWGVQMRKAKVYGNGSQERHGNSQNGRQMSPTTSEMKTSFRLGDLPLMVTVHGMTTNLMKIATVTFSNLDIIQIPTLRTVTGMV